LIGCRDQKDQRELQKFMARFQIVWPDASEFARAHELLLKFRLRSGIGIPDCLVAATVLSRNATLLSFNLKHFHAIPGLQVREPYVR